MIPASFPACATASRIMCLKEILMGEFPTVFKDDLSSEPMKVGEMKIDLTEKYMPYKISTPRQVPLRFQGEVGSTLKGLLDSGVITEERESQHTGAKSRWQKSAAGDRLYQAQQVCAQTRTPVPISKRNSTKHPCRDEILRQNGRGAQVLPAGTG